MGLNLKLILPEGLILSVALVCVLVDLIVPKRSKNSFFSVVSVSTLTLSLLLLVFKVPFSPQEAFFGFLKKDLLSVLAEVLIVFSALISVFVSSGYVKRFETEFVGEFYYTLLFATFGALLMTLSNELSTLFVSLEVTSVSVYVLISLFKGDYRGREAAFKYFVLGSIGAASLIYGFAILYGLSGSTCYSDIAKFVQSSKFSVPLILAMGFVIAGFLFKFGAFPFHGWMPDAYEGAPTPVTLFMGAVVKIASLTAFLRLFYPVFLDFSSKWGTVLAIFGVISAFFGALLALNQENVKRMLAYSSISHFGTILTVFVSVPSLSVFSAFFYVFAYAFMTLSAFGLISLLSTSGFKGEKLSDWKNLYSKSPLVALCLVIVFMSLAGIPPLFGFWAKFYVLMALVKAGKVGIAVALLIASLISLYFYLKPVVFAFMKSGEPAEFSPSPAEYGAFVVTALSLVFFGLFPELVSRSILLALTSFIKGI
jgi:NADH-quinone oxidoreductase subunit N